MAILHNFLNHNFGNGFYTENTILKNDNYDPEVLIIGTFNHGWIWNEADFFYGRGMFMWTVMANLFLHNSNELISTRRANNNNPNINEIFEICLRAKISFADLVRGTSENIPTQEFPEDELVIVNNNYSWRSYKDVPLDDLGALGWLDDNVNEIIEYINATPSIKHIYFTFKSGLWIVGRKNQIIINLRDEVSTCSIFTPTANGFGKKLPNPYNERAWSLAHCWVWNGLANEVEINREGYGHLDHEWLRDKGVNPHNF